MHSENGRERALSINGHRLSFLAYNEEKAGPPFVFIHGFTGTAKFWELLHRPALRDKVRWYSLSLIGHYPAALPPDFRREQLNAEEMGAIYIEALRKLAGDEPVVLVGHSTGGFAALNVAARAPARVRALISISGFASGRWVGGLGFNQMLARRFGPVGEFTARGIFRLSTLSEGLWQAIMCRTFVADRDAFRAFPGMDTFTEGHFPYSKATDSAALAHYIAKMPDLDITGLLPNIQAPTYVCAGTDDPAVPPAQSRLIAERVPGAKLEMIEESGHLPMIERPDAYHRILEGWIDEILQREGV